MTTSGERSDRAKFPAQTVYNMENNNIFSRLAQRYYEQLPAYEKEYCDSAEKAFCLALQSVVATAANIYCALSTKGIAATIFEMYNTSTAQGDEKRRQADATENILNAVQSIIAEEPTISALNAAFK